MAIKIKMAVNLQNKLLFFYMAISNENSDRNLKYNWKTIKKDETKSMINSFFNLGFIFILGKMRLKYFCVSR